DDVRVVGVRLLVAGAQVEQLLEVADAADLDVLGGGAGHRTGQAVELGGEALDVRRVGHYALDRALEHVGQVAFPVVHEGLGAGEDRKSTRLNSSHVKISYAVFCLKKKK